MRSNKNSSILFSLNSRFFLVRGLVLFVFSLLGLRLVYVQGFLRNTLTEKVDRQIPNAASFQNARRRIIDRKNVSLAETVQVESCFVDPSMMTDKALAARELSRAVGTPEAALLKNFRKTKGSFLWVKRNLEASRVRDLKDKEIPGIAFKREFRRNYPMGVMASHLLGLVGYEGKGLSGLEQLYDKNLNVPKGGDAAPANAAQGDLQLTIDSSIQEIVEKELDWGARKTGAKHGMALVQDPHTGEILAMAAWPPVSLDPDQKIQPKELRIPALMDLFEPGSTFKIVTAAAAIEEKVVKENETFDGEKGAWKVMDVTIHDHEPIAKMTLEDILIHSSNIGTSKLADRIGKERLYSYARLFGFGVFPGSGVAGESKGILRTPNQWSGVSKYMVSFGQEVSVSAVQLVAAFSAVANGGVLMEPRIVRGVVSEDGDYLWKTEPTEVRRVVSPATAKKLTDILTHVVERGTGVNAQIQWDPSTKVAGKTGTAQKYDRVHHRYHDLLALVSFCGFFPADNPKYTILVLLDEPEGRRWGGLDAAPVFRRIAEQISPRMQMAMAKQ